MVAMILLQSLGTTLASAASTPGCRVTDEAAAKTYVSLQSAVDAAESGDHLVVKGTCVGKTIIDTRLVIEGVTTRRFGRPTLASRVRVRALPIFPEVLVIKHRGRVRLWSLEVVPGWFGYRPGIDDRGRLVLRDVVVRGSRRCTEGGTIVRNVGFLSLRGSSSVSHNRCAPYAESGRYGGGGVGNGGTFVMNDASSISDNRGRGLANSGTVTMNDTSSIRANRALDDVSGGVWNDERAVFTMNDASTISDNSGSYSGGVTNLGTFTMNDQSSIHGNRATLGSAGGFANPGTLTMNDQSSIVGNTAATYAGGLHGWKGGPIGTLVGVICGPGGNVHDNTPDDCYIE